MTQTIVARRGGVEIRSVRLVIFGGIPYAGLTPAPPATEWRMACVGLVVSLSVATLCFALASAESNAESTILICVGWMNIGLCAIHLLPGCAYESVLPELRRCRPTAPVARAGQQRRRY